MTETNAAAELRHRLDALDGERGLLEAEISARSARLDSITRRRDALEIAIQEIEGDADGTLEGDGAPLSGPRPTIRQLAIRWAPRHRGVVRIRDFVRETQAHGFKSDHGGLHTALSGMREFRHEEPGVFRYYPASGMKAVG